MSLNKNATFYLVSLLSITVGLYPLVYFLVDREFGLLSSKSVEVLTHLFWNIGFYTHIILGGFALLIGWAQFSEKIRHNHLSLHRLFGKLYIVAAVVSGISGIYIAFYATGGLSSSLGFMSLGVLWVYTTLRAYFLIRNRDVKSHQMMMVYSFALCFAAVTLRLWLPALVAIIGDFEPAYQLVAWLCWIPNLLLAFIVTRKIARN